APEPGGRFDFPGDELRRPEQDASRRAARLHFLRQGQPVGEPSAQTGAHVFVPRATVLHSAALRLAWPMQNRSVKVDDISEETFVMVPDTCGLAQATRALFRSHRCKIHEYSGQALS